MITKSQLIESLNLSNRSTHKLKAMGIRTIGEFIELDEVTISNIKGLGTLSIKEILEAIDLCKSSLETNPVDDLDIIAENDNISTGNFSDWVKEEDNEIIVVEYLKEKKTRIDVLELLPLKAYNALLFADVEYLYEIISASENDLMALPNMNRTVAREIKLCASMYLDDIKEDIVAYVNSRKRKELVAQLNTIDDLIFGTEYREDILTYVKENDILISDLGMKNRPTNRLISRGYNYLSEIIFLSQENLSNIKRMGADSVKETVDCVKKYFVDNESEIRAFISGDASILLSDEKIVKRILNIYSKIGFQGLSFDQITSTLGLEGYVTSERLKSIIGRLIANKELEYVDYRCYRVFGKFEDYIDLAEIDKRDREILKKRLEGLTLEEIAGHYSLTRERVRQLVEKASEKVKSYYTLQTGQTYFDEDYYSYLYNTYAFEQKDSEKWLGISERVWRYLSMNDSTNAKKAKKAKKNLADALEDTRNLDAGMRVKIKNYLNRNKIFVDGIWVEKKRADLEKVVLSKYCRDSVSFDSFVEMYNNFLKDEEIDSSLYLTEGLIRTRINRLSEARFVLWKQNSSLRYYDIDGQDYTELLETLQLDSFENIDYSTLKFINDYPDVMRRYDIRDQYELHNLLRKIIPEGSYHDMKFGKMPIIAFGEPDREGAMVDLLIGNAPITQTDFFNLVKKEYGFDWGAIPLKPLTPYYHEGVYRIDQKEMSLENRAILKQSLTMDLYFINEIKDIYSNLVENADLEEINPYNLKMMGFQVYSKYALQKYTSLDVYFNHLLTKDDIIDITEYRKRFGYIGMFSSKLSELRYNLELIEFEKNQFISIKKLEGSGITKDIIKNYCNEVFDFVKDKEYFSVKSLRKSGFDSDLYEYGFSDVFYANLLLADERFSYGNMFGNIILLKGREQVIIKSFLVSIIKKYGIIDIYDLMNELADIYDCKISDKSNIINRLHDTEVYYDTILGRIYANKDLYYEELEKGDF